MIMLQKIMAVAARPLFSLPTPTPLFRTKPLLHFNHHHYPPRFSFERTPPVLVRSVTSTSAAPPLTDAPSRNSIEVDLKPYLSCSMPDSPKPLKVAVLLSGGVDSSVALRLLHAAGHSCTAFYLKIWFQEDFENFWSECPWDEDLKHAQAVCEQKLRYQGIYPCQLPPCYVRKVDVALEVVHLSEEYWSKVVSYIISEYRCGRTPNPDVLCNTRIKFGAFFDAIEHMEFDYIASGHYAHILHLCEDLKTEALLKLSRDMVKDQTYFLSHLSQHQLARLLFPLGCLTKEEVRRLAAKLELPNKDRKDSQGICFLGKVKFSEFIAKHIGEKEGILLEAETGDYLGKHRGFWFYTVGQRQGLRLPGGPWYVVEKDVRNNVIFVSRKYFSKDKRRRSFRVGSLKWLSGLSPGKSNSLRCKVRHGPAFYHCSVSPEVSDDGREESLVVHLSEDDQGLAAGQFTAFYQDDICIGSGVILDSWDTQGFPICSKALEIAQMEDKSKLGKPIRIVNLESDDEGSRKHQILTNSTHTHAPAQV